MTTDPTAPAIPTVPPPASAPAVPVHVIGATGKTGSRVLDRLHRAGVPAAARSRRSDPPFDWQDRGTWAPAISGARALYVTYVPDLAVDGAPEDVAALLEIAAREGVEHVVLLSGRGEANAERAELVLRSSGLAWTCVRASWFVQNFTEGALLDGVRDGVVALPAGDVPEPFVDVDDIADVVVAALTDLRHRGHVYEVTGPRSLTFTEVVAEIAALSGRQVQYVDVPPDDFRAALAAEAGPEYAAMLTDLCLEVFDGRNVRPGDGVAASLGRPARDATLGLREAARAGVWR